MYILFGQEKKIEQTDTSRHAAIGFSYMTNDVYSIQIHLKVYSHIEMSLIL